MDFFEADEPAVPKSIASRDHAIVPRAGGSEQRSFQGQPLAERMRPQALDEVVGHQKLLGPDGPLRRLIERRALRPLIFWGPPGTGKTTLARLLADAADAPYVGLSAVTATLKDARPALEEARRRFRAAAGPTVLFLDEIHRFNRAQQDAFLPYVEEGAVVLIGATTENPSFSLVAALLSRCHVLTLDRHSEGELNALVRRALQDEERGLGRENLDVDEDAVALLARAGDGDARRALNLLETAAALATVDEATQRRRVVAETVTQALQRPMLFYDKSGEEHYNLISALHKSLRASDVQASVYWCVRMLQSGEDPLYVARRMVRFASEDVGNADPQALPLALAAREAYAVLGTPEGELALVQCAAYLAQAPKSDAAYRAYGAIQQAISETGSLPVPMHIRNAPTGLMKDLGYGAGYINPHAAEDGTDIPSGLPLELQGRVFYHPDRKLRK